MGEIRSIVIDKEIQDKYCLITVHHLAFLASNHKPLLAVWQEDTIIKSNHALNRPKCFEEAWTRYEACREIVN